MYEDGSSHAITEDIRVEVDSHFVPERSDPRTGRWFFSYRVRITNEGTRTVQLLSRRWLIIDAHGQVEEITGPGVVGEQPVLVRVRLVLPARHPVRLDGGQLRNGG